MMICQAYQGDPMAPAHTSTSREASALLSGPAGASGPAAPAGAAPGQQYRTPVARVPSTQGLILVQSSAQLEPFLTQNAP
jgi:hypothetical protein